MLPKSELSTPAAGLTLYDVGFGECIVSSQMDTAELNHDQWSQVMASWLRTATPWRWEGLSGDVNNILSGGGQPGNSRTGALFSDAPFCSDCWSGESHCAISEKTSHLDAMDNTGYLADNLSCCVRLRNVFRRVEATYPDRGG